MFRQRDSRQKIRKFCPKCFSSSRARIKKHTICLLFREYDASPKRCVPTRDLTTLNLFSLRKLHFGRCPGIYTARLSDPEILHRDSSLISLENQKSRRQVTAARHAAGYIACALATSGIHFDYSRGVSFFLFVRNREYLADFKRFFLPLLTAIVASHDVLVLIRATIHRRGCTCAVRPYAELKRDTPHRRQVVSFAGSRYKEGRRDGTA